MRPGEPAPALDLKDQFGQDTSLAETLRDRASLLVFYPFAFSGICTGELTGIRDRLADFQNDLVQVLCISCDPMYALRAWSDAEDFTFPLLSDFWPHGQVSRAYGVFDEQSGMAVRGTFLVGRDARLLWSQVNGPGEGRDMPALARTVADLLA